MRIKTLATLLLSAATAIPIFAGEATLTAIDRPAGAPRTIAEGVKLLRDSGVKVRTARTTRGLSSARVRPNVIEYETADSAFLIPAAGSVQGNQGTFFRSDVTLGNFNSTTQNIGVGWLKVGTDNSKAPLTYFTIPGNSIVTINDFVGTQLHTSGLGGLLFIAFDSTGNNVGSNAFVDAFSRIWTPQPNTTVGTTSQSFPSVSLLDSADDFTAFALGLRQDSSYRTNVGVVNLDTAVHTWTIASVNTGASMTMTVQPFSLSQTGVPANFGGTSGNLSLTYDVTGTGFFWSAYASSVDNVTGDGWVSRATQ